MRAARRSLLFLLVGFAGAARAAPLWEGTDGPLKVTVTASDLTVTDLAAKPPRQLLSLAKDIADDVEAAKPGPDETPTNGVEFSMHAAVAPLSLVGGILSVERESEGYTGGAHPFASRTFAAIDLKTKTPSRLDALFPPEALLKALSADKFLKKSLDMKPFKTLGELLKAQPLDDASCTIFWSEDAMSSFAFVSYKGGKVGVRIGLTHGCEVERGNLTEIGIELPAPKALEGALASAKAGKTGFLLEDAAKRFKSVKIAGGFGD